MRQENDPALEAVIRRYYSMRANDRARRVFEWILRRRGLDWKSWDAEEKGVAVVKKRIFGAPPVD